MFMSRGDAHLNWSPVLCMVYRGAGSSAGPSSSGIVSSVKCGATRADLHALGPENIGDSQDQQSTTSTKAALAHAAAGMMPGMVMDLHSGYA